MHPARTIPYRELKEQLDQAIQARYVTENFGPDGLSIYCYTQSCTYDAAWGEATMLARGLVLDTEREIVVATPFPKFFNAFERDQKIPDLPFEAFDKIDGSLIILFHHQGTWYAETKRLFDTYQSRQAKPLLGNLDALVVGHTYLLEMVGPENKIVVDYPEPRLYLLSVYDETGREFSHEECLELVRCTSWTIAPRYYFGSFREILDFTKGLPADREGHVVRFENGLRLKIKGDEYCRIHATISGVTPLGMWEMMRNGDDLDAVRKIIPEEFYRDFDILRGLLTEEYESRFASIAAIAANMADMSDKELGLNLDQVPDLYRRLIFPYRKQPDGARLREAIFRSCRPDGNYLYGYVPSRVMHRVGEDT